MDIAAFDDAAQTSFKQNLATVAGVDVSVITLTSIVAASVSVTSQIETPNIDDASTAMAGVNSAIASGGGTTFLGVAVDSTPTAPTVVV
eukprot:3203066-Prymnesium_polylepis.1